MSTLKIAIQIPPHTNAKVKLKIEIESINPKPAISLNCQNKESEKYNVEQVTTDDYSSETASFNIESPHSFWSIFPLWCKFRPHN